MSLRKVCILARSRREKENTPEEKAMEILSTTENRSRFRRDDPDSCRPKSFEEMYRYLAEGRRNFRNSRLRKLCARKTRTPWLSSSRNCECARQTNCASFHGSLLAGSGGLPIPLLGTVAITHSEYERRSAIQVSTPPMAFDS